MLQRALHRPLLLRYPSLAKRNIEYFKQFSTKWIKANTTKHKPSLILCHFVTGNACSRQLISRFISTSTRKSLWNMHVISRTLFLWPLLKYSLLTIAIVCGGIVFVHTERREQVSYLLTQLALSIGALVLMTYTLIEGSEKNPLNGYKAMKIVDRVAKAFEEDYEIFLRERMYILDYNDQRYQKAEDILMRLLAANVDVYPLMDAPNKGIYKLIVYKGVDSERTIELSNGSIFVSTALIEKRSEEEIGFLLARSIARIVLDQPRETYAYKLITDLTTFTVFSAIGVVQEPVLGIFSLIAFDSLLAWFHTIPTIRREIITADNYAIDFAARACYDIRHVPVYFGKLSEKYLTHHSKMSRTWLGNRRGQFFTEPSFETRRQNIMVKLRQMLKTRSERGCAELDEKDNPIVEYEIAEMNRKKGERVWYFF